MARLRDTVAELNTKLGEARLQSAKHEADLLTCQVEKCVDSWEFVVGKPSSAGLPSQFLDSKHHPLLFSFFRCY